jgi:excisionase family DNA binding protein
MNTDSPAHWLTLKEAGGYAHCATITLMREIRAGRLRAYKLATRRAWRLRAVDIDSWISGNSGGDEPVPYGIPPTTGRRF